MGGYVASQELAHDPGTYLQYSSGSTTLLCSVLAARTGLGANLPRDLLFSSPRPEQRGARAGRGRHAGVQLVPVGHAARLGGGRPVRARRRRVERAAAGARGWLAESTKAVAVKRRRVRPLRGRVGGPTRGRTARSSSPGSRPTPTSPRATTDSGRSWCPPGAWSWCAWASPPRATTAGGSRPPSGCCARCRDEGEDGDMTDAARQELQLPSVGPDPVSLDTALAAVFGYARGQRPLRFRSLGTSQGRWVSVAAFGWSRFDARSVESPGDVDIMVAEGLHGRLDRAGWHDVQDALARVVRRPPRRRPSARAGGRSGSCPPMRCPCSASRARSGRAARHRPAQREPSRPRRRGAAPPAPRPRPAPHRHDAPSVAAPPRGGRQRGGSGGVA